jgi:tetratricopeptide (TPR) repeat protein
MRTLRTILVPVAATLAAARAGAPPAAEPPPAAQALEALDRAFRFASAIETDPKDRSRAQHAVVLDLAERGAFEEAVRRAETIGDWRRGAALASVGAAMARQGRVDEALALLSRAQQARGGVTGWQGPRIDAHVAEGLALLGERARAEAMAADLAAADRQYEGRAVAVAAVAAAAAGSFDEGLAKLAALDAMTDFEITWWRTEGYRELARMRGAPEEKRRPALDAAHRSAEGIPGWKRAQALAGIADQYREAGDLGDAREALSAAHDLVASYPQDLAAKAALAAAVAAGWSRLGEPERGRGILGAGLESVAAALVIDRPGLYADLAAGWHELGDDAEARRLLDLALEAAGGLRNSRPRALALVQVCRAIARAGRPMEDETGRRLDALYAGLGAPW